MFLDLVREQRLTPNSVTKIDVFVSFPEESEDRKEELTFRGPFSSWTDAYSSLPYALALGLVDGKVASERFRDDNLDDPVVAKVMHKITTVFEEGHGEVRYCRLDARKLVRDSEHSRISENFTLAFPHSVWADWLQADGKRLLSLEQLQRLEHLINDLENVDDVSKLMAFEIPTGNADKRLGVGKVWYKLPIWLQKNAGKWTFDGGAGYQVVPQDRFRNFPYTGWMVKKELGERLELGAEVFAHGREGSVAAQTKASTMVDVGGYYHFKHHPGEQFLFCYGHSVAGQTENYAYLGMYWTWGKDSAARRKGGAKDCSLVS